MKRSFRHFPLSNDEHRFVLPTTEPGESLFLEVNEEGLILDVTDKDGEIVGTTAIFWDDLEEMARESE